MTSVQLQIASSNVDAKSDNSFDFYIPPSCVNAESQEHIYLSVQSAVIPNTFYNINRYNNTLQFSLDSNDIMQTISLPLGNYTVTSLVQWFNTNMSGFSITYDKTTNKLAFQNNSYLNFRFYATSTIYSVIGFNQGLSYHSNGGYLSAINVCNLNSIQYVNVVTNNITTGNLSHAQINNRCTLCSIPVYLNPLGVLIYQNPNNFRINTFSNELTHISLSFRDQNENPIDFNGGSWSINLQMDIVNFVV